MKIYSSLQSSTETAILKSAKTYGKSQGNILSNNRRTTLDKITISSRNSSAPPTLTYTGHGMLEVYPENVSISYVVGHEQRHAQHNRMKAISRGEEVHQNIKYNLSFSNGKLIITGGVTEAIYRAKNGPELSIKHNNIEALSLGKDKTELEERLKNLDREQKNESDVSKSQLITEIERIRLKQKIGLIEKKISNLETRQMKKNIQKNSDGKVDFREEGIEEKSKDNITFKNIADLFTSSFNFILKRSPGITLLDSTSSALKVDDALNQLDTLDASHPLERDIEFNTAFIEQKLGVWEGLRERLSKLHLSSRSLKSGESFNIHMPYSSDEEKLTAVTNIDTKDGSHSIAISQTFMPHRIVSDIQSDPFQAINLTGTIKINGFDISIESSDSLNDIKNKINFGEDINNNGILDLTEDLNGNGILDILTLGEGENRVIIFEDIDLDRILDPSEDLNGNERIDGGSLSIGVRAEIENNQLILTSLNSQKIELTDDNEVLISLGIFTTDAHNNVIPKHYVSASQTDTILNREPQNAKLNIDNVKHKKLSNTISDIIPAVTLHLKASSDDELNLTIQTDVTKTFNLINSFVDSFNETIRFINDQMEFKKTMRKDPVIQRIRTNLIKNTTDTVESSKKEINNISHAGITLEHTDKKRYNEVAITNILQELKTELKSAVSLPSQGSNSIFSNMNDLGIITKADDTLTIDDNRLKTVLRDQPEEVFDLFSNETDGVAVRLKKQLNKILNEMFGTVTFQESVLASILNNPSTFEKIRQNINKVQNSFNNKDIITEVIG